VTPRVRRGTAAIGASVLLCAGCGGTGSTSASAPRTTPTGASTATAPTNATTATSLSTSETVTAAAGQGGRSDSPEVTFDVPVRWVTNEVPVPAGEQRWRVSWADNEDVEKHLAQQYGLSASLPLYDPSGTMTDAELEALGDPLARDSAYIDILVGDPPDISNGENFTDLETAPWSTLDDVEAYLTASGQSEGARRVSFNGLEGYSHTFTFAPLTTTIHELILRPGRRLFVSIYPADTRQLIEAEAIVASIRAAG
jgi:hypothetical protein